MVLINPPSLGTRSEGQCRPEFCPERPVPVLVEAHTDLPVRCDLVAEHDNVERACLQGSCSNVDTVNAE